VTGPERSVDPSALERLLEMTGGDPDFVDEIIQTFLEDAVVQLEAMRAAAAATSSEALVRPAHSLKGNSVSVGAERLAELCRELEADARSGSVDHAEARVAAAAAEFERVRTELAALREAP
jgi:HPt (histidine-containing phosphotransfer) domain-containing protein